MPGFMTHAIWSDVHETLGSGGTIEAGTIEIILIGKQVCGLKGS